ncbi:hypothetical protein PspLS_01748 [Pyricularia sp. CBS 133598]|nr:hypothetical protein PspLS_01748 [Pyricularia sp. CBS 133598]
MGLAYAVKKQLEYYGTTDLKVAFVEGDDVRGFVGDLKQPGRAGHLDIAGRDLSHAGTEIISANAYVGMSGIVAALKMGADIIISGRCCDVSPVMAGSLIAGHCIECSCYATGGNFSGFKAVPNNWNQGFPIAEINKDGSFDIFLLQDRGRGLVSKDTITA